jgi:site-specific DNA recombinase
MFQEEAIQKEEEEMKKSIIYTRFSPRSNAKECDSCEKQEERCIAYCNSKGYVELAVFSDKNVSGGTIDRPQLRLALDALQPGMVLVVDRNDRLARDMLVALTIHQEVEKKGCTIEFADGSPLRTTPEGKLFQNILAAFANFEREKFAERTKAGMARKKEQGIWCGRPPFGWTKIKGEGKLVENTSELGVIMEIISLSKRGFSSMDIANRLTSNFVYCRGRPWSERTIRRILARNLAKVST